MKDIPGYEGKYAVDEEGNVYSYISQRYLTPMNCGRKRYQSPTVDLLGKRFKVCHLVLLTFVGEKPEGTQACHNDGNQFNNNLENLRWDTNQANVKDTLKHGRHRTAKISYELAKEIRKFREQTQASYKDIGEIYGLDFSQVGRIIRGECWT